MNAPTMYRAIYQAPAKDGGKLRGMTFTASDAETAAQVAEDWQIYDTLLVLKPLRPLQRPLFTLTGA